jgi:class 3 adenylate cyclase
MSSPVTRFSASAAPAPLKHVRWPADNRAVVRLHNGSPSISPNGQFCGLFAADIAGFNGSRRDDDIQLYVHKSLYEMLEAAFERADVPWSGCAHEDRGDGVLVIIPPTIPVSGLVDPIPDRLRGLIRRHNRVSCDAARIQLRIATHIGPVHSDGHGFVGHDVNLLYRLLEARPLKRMLSESGAEVAFIASSYVYDNVIRRRPSLVDPALLQPLAVRVKETRTRAWAYVLGA